MTEPAYPFAGWPVEALDWFHQLDRNNTREWFQANRSVYDEAVRRPMAALLAEVEDEFGPGTISRPNRDTRFSPDKTPYKLQIYARVPHPGGGVYYVQLRPEGLFAGAGLYLPDPKALARLRAAIADDRSGPRLASIVAELESQRIGLLEDGGLKTAPRGFPADHPRIRFLRLRHLAAGTQYPVRRWLHTRGALRRVVEPWRALDPLLQWAAEATR